MTHFSVLVVGPDPAGQLEPYNEEKCWAEHPDPDDECGHPQHWDWYVLGGRWEGFFTLKGGRTADASPVGLVDWPATFEHHPSVSAIVAEGKWKAPGRVGWFGLTTAEPEQEADFDEWLRRDFVPRLDPALVVSLYDCHV